MTLRLDPPPGTLHPTRLVPVGRERRERERNWGVFDDGALRAVYTIDPHVVLALDEREGTVEARPAHETSAAIPWDGARWGEPHAARRPSTSATAGSRSSYVVAYPSAALHADGRWTPPSARS